MEIHFRGLYSAFLAFAIQFEAYFGLCNVTYGLYEVVRTSLATITAFKPCYSSKIEFLRAFKAFAAFILAFMAFLAFLAFIRPLQA